MLAVPRPVRAGLLVVLFVLSCGRASLKPEPGRVRLCPWGEPRASQPGCVVLRNTAYDCCWSREIGIARWVSYCYVRTPYRNLKRCQGEFVPDPRLGSDGPTPVDFQGMYRRDLSGFDRGHQAPDASVKAFGVRAQAETYYLTNITPQHSRLNQGLWVDLEQAVRNWAGMKDTVWVVTGPVLFADQDTEWVGVRGRTAVPHAYFLVVGRRPRRLDTIGAPEVLSFLVPNHDERISRDSISLFLVSVDSVEAAAGLELLPRLPGEEAMEARCPTRVWAW